MAWDHAGQWAINAKQFGHVVKSVKVTGHDEEMRPRQPEPKTEQGALFDVPARQVATSQREDVMLKAEARRKERLEKSMMQRQRGLFG